MSNLKSPQMSLSHIILITEIQISPVNTHVDREIKVIANFAQITREKERHKIATEYRYHKVHAMNEINAKKKKNDLLR